MADRTSLNNQLNAILTAIVDIPQHLQANQAMLDYVDAQDATKSGTGHTHGLFTLSDVTQAQPFSNRHFLFYNAGDGKWKNGWLNDGDIPNIDMSKVATGSLAWSRISGAPVTLTGYGINNLTLPSLSGSTTGYIMADENGNLIRVDNPLKAYSESEWGTGTYGAVIDSGDGSADGMPRNRLFVNPDNGVIFQSDAPDSSYYSRIQVQGDTVELASVSGGATSSMYYTPNQIDLTSKKITVSGTTYLGGSSTGRTIIGSSTDDGSNKLQVSGNTKFVGALTQSGGIVYLNSNGVNRTIIGSSNDDGTNRLQISGSTYLKGALTISGVTNQTGGNVYLNNAGINRTIIGSSTDDGSNRLQVSGNVVITGNMNLTGTITTTGAISSPSSISGYTLTERFGAGSSITGPNTTAIGATASAGAADSTAIGRGATCASAASNGVAVGSAAQATGANTTAVGTGSVAGNQLRCSAFGTLSSATGYFSAAIGGYSAAAGAQSTALGVAATSSNTSTVAAGTFATASGLRSIAIGGSTSDGLVKTSATHTDSIALGYGAASSAANQFMIGTSTTNYNMYLNGGLTFTNCPEYVDNAAAVAAGLAVGRVYRTGDLLKIVH